MPQIDFSSQNNRSSEIDFEKLKLRKNERARIVCVENPTFAWSHTFRAPKIVNGQAEKVEKRRRNGDTYIDYVYDYMGRPLCLGDLGILEDKGIDFRNCPACRRASETDEVSPPERRYAMNVIRYGMNADGTKVVQPFSCSCVVWAFPEGTFRKLGDIQAEHGQLKGKDLLLGPCTEENWQKYEIQPGAQNIWQLSPQIKQHVLSTYAANKAGNLERACGRKTERRFVQFSVDRVAERWLIVRGQAPSLTDGVGQPSLTEGLNDLSAAVGLPAQATSAPGVVPSAVDLAGLLDSLPSTPSPDTELNSLFSDMGSAEALPTSVSAPPSDVFATVPATSSVPASSDAPIDFDELLKGL